MPSVCRETGRFVFLECSVSTGTSTHRSNLNRANRFHWVGTPRWSGDKSSLFRCLGLYPKSLGIYEMNDEKFNNDISGDQQLSKVRFLLSCTCFIRSCSLRTSSCFPNVPVTTIPSWVNCPWPMKMILAKRLICVVFKPFVYHPANVVHIALHCRHSCNLQTQRPKMMRKWVHRASLLSIHPRTA